MVAPRAFAQHNIFTDLLIRGVTQGQAKARSKKAVEWYRNAAREQPKVNRTELIRSQQVKHVTPNKGFEVGSMYMYNYDPKWKAELEVYDTYPVVIPFRIEKDRFWAINFHYLPYKERGQLMDILHTITNNKKYDDTTKLKITYKILQKIATKKLYEDTIHCYLKRKVKSRMLYVLPNEWEIALFLPIARFHGPRAAEYTGH